MKRLAGIIFVIAACTDSKAPEPRKRAGEDRPKPKEDLATIEVVIPEKDDFSNDTEVTKNLRSYVYKLTTDDRHCYKYQAYEISTYRGGSVESLEVDDRCEYELNFSIGRERTSSEDDDIDLEAYYHTDNGVLISKKRLQKEGDVEVNLHLKRTVAGEKLGFRALWVRVGEGSDDLGDDPDTPTDDDDVSSDDDDDDSGGTQPPTNKVSYEGGIREILGRKCTSCHSSNGSRSTSDLTNFASVKSFQGAVVSRVLNRSMPPGAPLSSEEIKKFSDWREAGYPEKSETTGGGASSGDGNTNGLDGTGVYHFRIPAGTGSGPWNSQNEIVEFKVGQTLRIHNDDTQIHQLHTNGAPCPHGSVIRPGAYEDCIATSAYSGPNLYDHNTRGAFYLRVTN